MGLMSTWEITAQAFGILALAANVLSFHFKEYRQIIIVQILSSVFFTVHFVLLYVSGRADALTAGVLNGLSLFRNGLLLCTEKNPGGNSADCRLLFRRGHCLWHINMAFLGVCSVYHRHGTCDSIHVCSETKYASFTDDDRGTVCFCIRYPHRIHRRFNQ